MTNWASRQGFTEFIRAKAKVSLHGSATAKLSKGEEIGCGVVGGVRPLETSWFHWIVVIALSSRKRTLHCSQR